jgi:DNA polymerase-3 subunit gamma/tau
VRPTVNKQPESLSIYRRWRPQRFGDVVGQEEIVRTLRNAVSTGNAAHAYLFAGERGIGKTSIARILARAVNCLQSHDGEPCNECANCSTILASRSLDIIEIDGASNRGIDHIRRLREEVSFTPTDLKRKVYIIDEVHMLTNEAFNALLKTLEEPPPHAMFMFATTEPYKVPRTIVSRCQAFEFRRIPPRQIEEHLARVAESEGVAVSAEAVSLLAQRANGGMRDALVMLEQAMSYQGTDISADAVLDMLGLVERSAQEAFIQAIRARDRESVIRTIDNLVDRGKDLEIFLTDVVHILRDRLADGSTSPDADIEIARQLLAIKGDLFRSLDRRIRLEIGLLDLLASLPPSLDRSQASPQPEAPKRTRSAEAADLFTQQAEPGRGVTDWQPAVDKKEKTRTHPSDAVPVDAPAPTTPPAETVAEPNAAAPQPEGLEETWDALLREIEQDRIAIAAFLIEGRPCLVESNLVISFHPEHSFHKDSIEKRENMQYLAGVVRRHFGDGVHVEVEIDEGVVRKPLPHEVLQEKARLVCKVFDGRIVKEEL